MPIQTAELRHELDSLQHRINLICIRLAHPSTAERIPRRQRVLHQHASHLWHASNS